MRKSTALAYLLLLALPVLVGLTVSTLLLVDYLSPSPLFCEVGGGCDRIRATAFSSFLHLPLPVYGVAGFTVMGTLVLLRGRRARQILLALAAAAALIAVFLLSVQVAKDTFCKFCIMVDLSSLVLAAGALFRSKREWDFPEGRIPFYAGAVGMLLAVGVPIALGRTRSGVPETIASEIRKTPPGKVTVVDFVDFECPFCRMTNVEFSPVLETYASRVRLVRKQVPLPMHPHAIHAARAACCGEKLGKGDAMAEALFTAEDLTPAGCDKVAQSLGLDLGAFEACIHDPSTDQQIQKESAEFRATLGRGLPTIWIDGEKFEGLQEGSVFEQAMTRAMANKS